MRPKKRIHGYPAPETIVKKSAIHSLGVFAAKNIKRGMVVVAWGGRILTKAEIKKLPKEIGSNYALPVYPGFYIAETSRKELDNADFVNHSCEPNCIIKNLLVMITKRNIKQGEELTCNFDHGRGVGKRTRCFCDSKHCKKYVYF